MSAPGPLYHQVGPNRFEATELTAGPWAPDAQHGSPVAALLLHCIQEAAGAMPPLVGWAAATGGLTAAVPQGWAMVSLDGGPQQETPATWNDIAIGLHVLRLERPGFQTIVDTVSVPPGQVLRRQYTLRPGGS